jgi:hypothetical protein
MRSMGRLGRYTAVASRRVDQGELIGGCRADRAIISGAMIARHELGEARELSPSRPRLLQALLVISLAAVVLAGCLSLRAPNAIASSTFPATASLDTFERAAESPLSDGGKWSKLGWTKTIGRVFSSTFGWVPKEGGAGAPESEADGAYWNAASFTSPAVSVHMYPENLHDYVALWCDTTGTGSKNGYRLKVVGIGSKDAFRLILEKWVGGVKTVLAESSEIDFTSGSHENTIGLTDMGGTVQGWYGTAEASLGVKIEASDSTFTSGNVGIEGTNDNAYGETKYRAASTSPPINTVLPAVSGFDEAGVTLFATTGTWTGVPTSYAYQWQRCKPGCTNIASATASSYTLGSEDVSATIRVVVTASNASGSTEATSASTNEIAAKPLGPLATVYNAGGQPIGEWGSFYGNRAGTQIQLAENFAECGSTEGCPEGSKAIYHTVKLEPGTYHLLSIHGAGPYPWCYGILAYSGVALEGSTEAPGSVIEDQVAFHPGTCPENENVEAVVGVGGDPGDRFTPAENPHISGLVVQAHENAEYGILLRNTVGSAIDVSGNTVYDSNSIGADILIGQSGVSGERVVGSSTAYAQIVDNTVVGNEHSHEGIVVDGEYIRVAGNHSVSLPTAGIAAYGYKTQFVEIAGNEVSGGTAFGISLDGSLDEGRHDTVTGNYVKEVCQGLVLYNQVDTTVANNEFSIPAAGWDNVPNTGGCTSSGLGIPGTLGVRIESSWANVYYNNSIGNFDVGFRLYDGGTSPEGHGTTANYVGRTWGSTWPWPIEGNAIVDSAVTFKVEGPGPDAENEFVGNTAYYPRGPICEFNAAEFHSDNTPEC